MKKTYIIILWVMIALVSQSCNNADTPNPVLPGTTTNADLLKTWKASQVTEGSTDVTTSYASYRITFEEANGLKTFSLTTRTGTIEVGSWALSTDQTTLTLTLASGGEINLTGVVISASELKYTSNETGKTGSVNVSLTLIPA